MSAVNPATREIAVKIVYYGPGLGGKTSSLQAIHQSFRPDSRGPLVSLATGGDRTLYFDFLPVTLANLRGYSLRVQLYTVPGQVQYNATRKLVLAGCDGVVFVADSQPFREAANAESLENLRENLSEQGMRLEQIPHVLQLNKRDAPGAQLVSDMAAQLNPHGVPQVETVATTGRGVFDGLRSILALVLSDLRRRGIWDGGDAHPPTAVPEFDRPHAVISERIVALANEHPGDDDEDDQDYVVEVERVNAVLADEPPRRGADEEDGDEEDDEELIEIHRVETRVEAAAEALANAPAPAATQAEGTGIASEGDGVGERAAMREEDREVGEEPVKPGEVVAVERAGVADEPAPDAVLLDDQGEDRDEDVGDGGSEPLEYVNPGEIVAIERAEVADEPAADAVIIDERAPAATSTAGPVAEESDALIVVEHIASSDAPAEATDAFAAALSAGGEGAQLERETSPPLGLAALLTDGPEREAVLAVEEAIARRSHAEAVRIAARVFAEAARLTAEGESGPLLHALARGLSGRRYLRFRALAEEAEQGRASQEDALYAAFFLVDAALDR